MNMPMELVLFKKSGMKFHCLQGLFDSECMNAFFHVFTHSESFICLSDNSAVHEEDGHEGLNLLMVDDRIPAGAKLY